MKRINDISLIESIKELNKKNYSMRDIARQLNCSKSVVKRILREDGLFGIKSNGESELDSYLFNKVEQKDGYSIIAKCKQTGKEFKDYKNVSGALSVYLLSINPSLEIPSQYKRKNYFFENGKFWHEQYFDIIKKEIEYKETKQCKYCLWKTVDLNNKSGMYTLHLKKEHNKDIGQYLIEFPEEEVIFKCFMDNKAEEDFLNEKEENSVQCQLCGKKMRRLDTSHLSKAHNITMEEYKKKFLFHKTTSATTSKILSLSTIEHNRIYIPKKEGTQIEIAIKNKLDSLEINYTPQKRNGSFFYDFFLDDYELFLETDGIYWHGHDRDFNWDVSVFKNIMNDYRKTLKAPKLCRLIEELSINHENLKQVESRESFFNFLSKEHFDIKRHKLFNLKDDENIFSREFCIDKQDFFIKKKISLDLTLLVKDFYSPDKYKKFTNYQSRHSEESLLKAILFEPFYQAHKIGDKNIHEIFLTSNGNTDSNVVRKAIEYRLGINKSNEYFDINIKNIYRGIEVRTLFNVGIFPVKQCRDIYREFVTNDKSIVYDPFSGWCSRLLGMEDLIKDKNCIYIGSDNNESLRDGYNEVINLRFFEHKDKISLNIMDSKIYCHELKERVDFIFTSPPFFNDEIYQKGQLLYKTLEEWKEDMLIPVFSNCYSYLKEGSSIVIDMKELYKEVTKDALKEVGFTFIEERGYGVNRSHYGHKNNKDKSKQGKKQYLLIFKK